MRIAHAFRHSHSGSAGRPATEAALIEGTEADIEGTTAGSQTRAESVRVQNTEGWIMRVHQADPEGSSGPPMT